jgi:hypothetical protein
MTGPPPKDEPEEIYYYRVQRMVKDGGKGNYTDGVSEAGNPKVKEPMKDLDSSMYSRPPYPR